MEVVAKLFEFVAVELFFVILYDAVRHPIMIDDVFIYKLLDLCRRDGCECLYFYPLGEVIDCHHYILNASSSFGELAN